jgi:hypothetical protein
MYIADTFNHCIRKITTDGIISTAVGVGGVAGSSGDGGPVAEAKLNEPRGIYFDSTGTLYIADSGNHKIRTVTNGLINSVFTLNNQP